MYKNGEPCSHPGCTEECGRTVAKTPWVFNPAHELYKADDPELQNDEFLYFQVVEGGLGICKKCGKMEVDLDEECEKEWHE